MTSRERIRAALRQKPVDYVPCCAVFNPLDPPLRRGYQWNFPWPANAPLQERLHYQVEHLGLDQIVDAHIDLCRPAYGVKARTWVDKTVLHKTYSTSAGELHASVRYNRNWPHGNNIPFYSDFNIAHFIDPWIGNKADLECFKQVVRLTLSMPVLKSEKEKIIQAQKLAQHYKLATLAHVGMGLSGAQQLFGAEPLCLKAIDQPGLIHAYLDYEHDINLRTIEFLSDYKIDILRRNGFYESGDFFSPQMLEKFIGEKIRREAQAGRTAGMLTSYTVHTGVAPILDYLSTLTVDSFFGIDIAFKDIDLKAVKQSLKQTLWIGPSSTYHLWQGPQATRRAVRALFSTFGKTGIILSPAVSAHSIMPWQSTLAMIDEWKKRR